jgi:hypothetical protein
MLSCCEPTGETRLGTGRFMAIQPARIAHIGERMEGKTMKKPSFERVVLLFLLVLATCWSTGGWCFEAGEEANAPGKPLSALPSLVGTWAGTGNWVANAAGVTQNYGTCSVSLKVSSQKGSLFRGTVTVTLPDQQPETTRCTGSIAGTTIYITQDNNGRTVGTYSATNPPMIVIHWGNSYYPTNSGVATLKKQ